MLDQRNVGKVLKTSSAEFHLNRGGQQSAVSNREERKGRDKAEKNFTHFLSIPVKDPLIIQNYTELQKDILAEKIKGVSQGVFTKAHQHHLTILMLDLSDPAKLELAKKTLQSLERTILVDLLGAENGEDPEPITISFKGIKTFQTKNP